jgi:hypothetical protein
MLDSFLLKVVKETVLECTSKNGGQLSCPFVPVYLFS